MTQTPSKGFLFNVNLVFAGTVMNAAVSLTIAVLLARTLGPDGRGVTSLYQSAVNVGFMVLSPASPRSCGLGCRAHRFERARPDRRWRPPQDLLAARH